MSTGIAERGQEVLASKAPAPLPVQALDYTTGYLLASAICQALRQRLDGGKVREIYVSLARTAVLLVALDEEGEPLAQPSDTRVPLRRTSGAFFELLGPLQKIRWPVALEGVPVPSELPAGPLGRDEPAW